MLRKKTSTKLLAFIVAAVTVIPTTAFAADTAEQTKQGTDPAVLFTSEEAPAIPPADGQTETEAQPAGEASAPAVTEPAVTDPQTPAVTEPAVTDPQTPATTEPAVTDPQIPATPDQPEVQTPPAVVVTDAGIIAEETTTEGAITSDAAIVTEEATMPAITVEPVLTNLTITHHLTLDNGESEYTETIQNVEFESDFDLTAVVDDTEGVQCVSDFRSIKIDEMDKKIVLEYRVVKEENSSENEELLDE